jgi:hypothetical protein
MQASGMGFGREGSICEKHIIMQTLPGSSDDLALINAPERFCNSFYCVIPGPAKPEPGIHDR